MCQNHAYKNVIYNDKKKTRKYLLLFKFSTHCGPVRWTKIIKIKISRLKKVRYMVAKY